MSDVIVMTRATIDPPDHKLYATEFAGVQRRLASRKSLLVSLLLPFTPNSSTTDGDCRVWEYKSYFGKVYQLTPTNSHVIAVRRGPAGYEG